MKTEELIKKLEEIGPGVEVFVPGYEGGYREINEAFHIVDIALDINTHWWLGRHERLEQVPQEIKDVKTVKAIIL